jgi:ABC-2 type transport system permease protein
MFLRDAENLVDLVNRAAMILAGVAFPLSVLPIWLRGMARVTPLAWVLTALRAVLINGSTWGDLKLELTVLSAMAVGFPIFGYFVFRVFETLTRRRGALSGY